jgi:trigger factor
VSPSVSLEGEYAPGKDAEIKVELEVLPDVPTPSIDALKLERLTVPVSDDEVNEQLKQLAGQQKAFADAPAKHKAAEGDQVTMDFVGSVDGVAFDGGTGEGMQVEIGTGRLIPGFEDQLVGVKAGDEKTIDVTFPADYGVADLAGKPAQFALKITAVKTAGETVIDDDFAKTLGLQSLEQLTGLLKGQLEQQLGGLTRTYMKRKLLDQLAAGHDFEVPPSMVDAEFEQIWGQLQHEAEHEADPEAAKAELEAEREDYVKIAERRVRLGLLLSEIGTANGVEVSSQEMNQLIDAGGGAVFAERPRALHQYVRNEPMAAAQLRAPLFEDKVVDYLFDKAEISDREVTRDELEAAIESDEGFDTGTHSHDHDNHKPRAKKAKAEGGEAKAEKKPAAKAKKADKAEEPAAEAEPVKKAAAKKAPAKKAEAEADEAPAKPAKKAPAKKKAD